MRYEHYIGVDLHKKNFQACTVTADGARCWELAFPRTAAGLLAFKERCTRATAVAVEASGPTWHFADAISDRVGQVVIVDPLKTRLKAGYAAKTDRLDARRLADALRRDSVVSIYHPPPAIRELRELCRSRQALVRTRTALGLRLQALLLRQGFADTPDRLHTPTGQQWLAQVALPPQAAAGAHRLARLLAQTTRELQQVTREVEQTAAQDPIACALTRLVGIGPILALLIRAEIGTIERFPTPGHLASYAARAGGGNQRGAHALRPHHAARVAVVAVGVGRSGGAWAETAGRRRAVGPAARAAQRRAEGACGDRTAVVCADPDALAALTSSPAAVLVENLDPQWVVPRMTPPLVQTDGELADGLG
jgi:transposase